LLAYASPAVISYFLKAHYMDYLSCPKGGKFDFEKVKSSYFPIVGQWDVILIGASNEI